MMGRLLDFLIDQMRWMTCYIQRHPAIFRDGKSAIPSCGLPLGMIPEFRQKQLLGQSKLITCAAHHSPSLTTLTPEKVSSRMVGTTENLKRTQLRCLFLCHYFLTSFHDRINPRLTSPTIYVQQNRHTKTHWNQDGLSVLDKRSYIGEENFIHNQTVPYRLHVSRRKIIIIITKQG